MGSAAGRPIDSLYLDDPDLFHILRQPRSDAAIHHLLVLAAAHRLVRDRHIVEYRIIHPSLHLLYLTGRDLIAVQVYRAGPLSQVETDRRESKVVEEDAREEVLPGMLLHMIEPSLPIDPALYLLPLLEHYFDYMEDTLFAFLHINNFLSVQRSPVRRLPTRFRVEERAL